MLTVLTWFNARRSRRSLGEAVLRTLTDRPTLLCIVSDQFRQESHLRPFSPLAEALGERMQVVVAAEWPQEEREAEGSLLLRQLGLVQWAWPRMLLDRGSLRGAVVLREKKPVALIDLFFAEKDRLDGNDAREAELRGFESGIVRELERLLVRLPGQPVVAPPRSEPPAERSEPIVGGLADGLRGLATRIEQVNPEGGSAIWEPPPEPRIETRTSAQRRPGVTIQTVTLSPRAGARTAAGRPGVQVVSQPARRSEPAPEPLAKPAPKAAPQPAKDEGPKRDRFELIELD